MPRERGIRLSPPPCRQEPGEGARQPSPRSARPRRRLLAPLLTALIAFLIAGIVVLITTGSFVNPSRPTRRSSRARGLDWFLAGSSCRRPALLGRPVWFPWNINHFEPRAASTSSRRCCCGHRSSLTGLAVAFAFRCGLFNIGGQGQYLVGSIAAVMVGAELASRRPAGYPARGDLDARRHVAGQLWPGSPACSRRPSARTR